MADSSTQKLQPQEHAGITFGPSGRVKVLAFFLALIVAFGWRQLVFAASAYTVFGWYLLAVGTVFLTVLLVDALQRRYEITMSAARVRFLFGWKRKELPAGVRPATDSIGRIILYDHEGKQALFTIPKEYNLDGQLARRIRSLFNDARAID